MKIIIFSLDEKLEPIILYSNREIFKPNNEIINLFSISNGTNSHLCLIRNLSALTNANDTQGHYHHICGNCLNFKAYKEKILDQH